MIAAPRPHAGQIWSALSATTGRRRFVALLAHRRRGSDDAYVNAIEITAKGHVVAADPANPHRGRPFDIKLNPDGSMPAPYALIEGKEHTSMSSNAPTTAVITASKKTTAAPAPRDPRLPKPGTKITAKYKGKTYEATVLAEGFEFKGEHFSSLSGVGMKIRGGKATNGFQLFGLIPKPAALPTGKEMVKKVVEQKAAAEKPIKPLPKPTSKKRPAKK